MEDGAQVAAAARDKPLHQIESSVLYEGAVETRSLDLKSRQMVTLLVSVALCVYVLVEVNFSLLSPLRELSLFATGGLLLAFLQYPMFRRWQASLPSRALDWILAILSLGCCGYLLFHGSGFGQRVAMYGTMDLIVGAVGLMLIWEATRRAIGPAVPILALVFLVYAHQSVAQQLPDWLFPHRGQDWQSLIGQLYLRTEGVFGTALGVMFRYVFLFVVFGALLEASGATQYVIQVALRFFGKQSGGPAKVAVLSSGLMGSLSGSAVANAATTGVFTIPLMRSIGFKPHTAAAVEAAASSGGALAPPVMGAGAYMMLEIINRQPPVTYLEIMRAALIPALLYYVSLFLLVHFHAKRSALTTAAIPKEHTLPLLGFEGLTFFGALASLIGFLLSGVSPFRAVSYSLVYILLMILLNPRTAVTRSARIGGLLSWLALTVACKTLLPIVQSWQEAVIWSMAGVLGLSVVARQWRPMALKVFRSTALGSVSLIVVAACVGMVIGLVSRTGIGTGIPQAIIPLAGNSLFLGLVAIMCCSLLLGMGLPSAVSYLLLATIIGPVFADPALGVPILAAHLFIFYFGMMAMVTPPVALAGYATASIAGASVMRTSLTAFCFSLVGYTLPFMFVYRPALCWIGEDGGSPQVLEVVIAVAAALVGIVALSSAMAGYLFGRLNWPLRALLFAAAACALFPDQFNLIGKHLQLFDLIGVSLLVLAGVISYMHPTDSIPSGETCQT